MARLFAILCALVLFAALPGAVRADERSLPQGPGQRPGPDVLYEPLAAAPQLQNEGIWRAAPILISGASAYRDGEFLYQDWLYDDHGARAPSRDPADRRLGSDAFSSPNGTYTYPTDAKYADNAADLVELRVRALPDATAIRLTYNTLLDPEIVGTTIGLGSSPAPHELPNGGAPARMPAAYFLTVHGASAELVDAATKAPVGSAPAVSVSRERRQVEIRVPRSAWDPGRSVVRMGAATGVWDPATNAYVRPGDSATASRPGGAPGLASPAPFFNVAFRYETRDPEAAPAPGEEPTPVIENGPEFAADPRWWRDKAQADALESGDLTPLFAEVDFGKLADGVDDDMAGAPKGVPQAGVMNRILASHWEPAQGVDFRRGCGAAIDCEGQLLGQLQPYAIYVPPKAPAGGRYGLTLLLHSLGANYNQFTASRNQAQFGDRGGQSIVITPAGRGPDGWYWGLAGADTFEVWADVAARYPLEPDRAVITGYSMGGYGTYKLATQYPDLFARGQPTVGPPTLGLSGSGRDSTGGPETSTLPMLPSLRHVPMLMWAGSTDQLVPVSSTIAQAQAFDDLGYRYIFDLFAPAEHFTLAVNDQFGPAAAYLGDARVVRDPDRVTYVINPKMDFANRRTVGDHAYWLSGLRVRDTGGDAPRGAIDVKSGGFGAGEPTPQATRRGAGMLEDTRQFPLTFTEQAKDWEAAPRTAVANRLNVLATNVARVVVDVKRARVGCDVALEVDSDGPIAVELAGCARVERFGGPGPRSCRAAVGFARVAARRAGRGVRFEIGRLVRRPFAVDVFRQSRGRRVLGNRRVFRAAARRGSFTWRARGRRVGDGIYVARVRMKLPGGRTDVRRLALVRRGGRFRVRAGYYRRRSCGLLSSFKLERPVFGGRANRALGIAFQLSRASRVSVRVVRGKRTVKRFRATTRRARRTHRLRLPSERLRRGNHRVIVRVVPAGGGPAVTATLVAKRL